MKLACYPPQEPLSPLGAAYQTRVMELGRLVDAEEVAYGPDPYQSLAVFRPAQPSGDVLVFFHGGGWTSGYKEWMYFMAPAVTALGVTFVSAGYRLAPAHLFPAGLNDAADAIGWVVARIAGHGGNPARVFIGGHSAGAHYAALLAVTSGWRFSRGLAPRVVRGCLPVSGVYRFGAQSGLSMRPRFLGPTADVQIDAAASPLLSIEADTCPPFLLSHGARDFPHLLAHARQMAEALARAGVAVDVEVLEDCDHFEASVACGDPDGIWVRRAAQWMRQVRD